MIERRTANHLAEWAGASALLLLATALTCYRIAEPAWEMGNQGYMLSQHVINARNFQRFGPVRCGGCLVNCYGARSGDTRLRVECGVRSDTPPLMQLVMAGLYSLFGESETASRLPAAASSIALVMLIYAAGRTLATPAFGLTAGLFAAMVPIRAYYGRLADGTIVSVLFSTAAFLSYLRLLTTRSQRWAIVLGACFTAAVAFGWNGYFTGPALLVHAMLYRARVGRFWRIAAVVAAATLGAFLLHMAWAFWCGGQHQLDLLGAKFLERTAFGDIAPAVFSPAELLLTLVGRLDRCTTPVLTALAFTGFLGTLARLRRRTTSACDEFGIMVFVYWSSQVLVLQNTVAIHDFFMLYPAVPFLALAGASGSKALTARLPRRGSLRPATALLVMVCFIGQAGQLLHEYHRFPPEFTDDVYAARTLRSMTAPDEPIFFDARPRFPRFWAYLDRRVELVESVDHLRRIVLRLPDARYFVLAGRGAASAELRGHLFAMHAARQIGQFTVFDLMSRRGATTASSIVATEREGGSPTAAVDLAALTVRPESLVLAALPGGMARFFNTHPELSDGRMLRVRVMCDWHVHETPAQRLYTRVRLIHASTGITEAQFVSEPFDGNLPTTEWQPGHTVHEHLDLLVGDIPPGRYRVEAALVDTQGAATLGAPAPSAFISVQRQSRAKPMGRLPSCRVVNEALTPSPLEFIGWQRRGARVSTFWRVTQPWAECLAARLCFAHNGDEAFWNIGLLPCSEWLPGEIYRLDAEVPEDLLPASALSVAVNGPDEGQEWEVALGQWSGDPSSEILARIGMHDQSSDDCARLSLGDTLSVSCDLQAAAAVDLAVWWTGAADMPHARLHIWSGDGAANRRQGLSKVTVRADRPGACRLRSPATTLSAGRSTLYVTLIQTAQPWIGWRQWATRLVPRMTGYVGGRPAIHARWLDLDCVEVHRPTPRG